MPATVAKFRTNGDAETADLLEHIIYKARRAHPGRCPAQAGCQHPGIAHRRATLPFMSGSDS